jgi:tetratricopeptide (TPR) repeat protein
MHPAQVETVARALGHCINNLPKKPTPDEACKLEDRIVAQVRRMEIPEDSDYSRVEKFSKAIAAYESAKEEPDYANKMRLLRAIADNYSDLPVATEALDDLWQLQEPLDCGQARQTYEELLKLKKIEPAQYTYREINTIVRFIYHQEGKFEEALKFLQWHKEHNKSTGKAGKAVKSLITSLQSDILFALGKYDNILAGSTSGIDYSMFSELRRKLAGKYAPFSLYAGYDDMAQHRTRPNMPVYIYVNPSIITKLKMTEDPDDPKLKERINRALESPFYKAIANRDRKFFEELIADISAAFSYLSGGKFKFVLKEVSFDEIKTVREKGDYEIDLATAPEILDKADKAYVIFIAYPTQGPSYAGHGLVFLKGPGFALYDMVESPNYLESPIRHKVVAMHEIMHGLVGHLHFPNLEQKGHKFLTSEISKNVECLNTGHGSWQLGISRELRKAHLPEWPEVPWLTLDLDKPTLREQINAAGKRSEIAGKVIYAQI